MSVATARRLMTYEEFVALPEDGTERELIRGVLKIRGDGQTMTRRSRKHCRATTKVAWVLNDWLLKQPEPRGEVLTGEAAFRLSRDAESAVGIDVAYVDPELSALVSDDVFDIEGAPTLAVEVLSPSDIHPDIVEKIDLYLKAGVPLVWIVDPDLKVVQVHRPQDEPISFNVRQELTGDPHLPGLRVCVADLFG